MIRRRSLPLLLHACRPPRPGRLLPRLRVSPAVPLFLLVALAALAAAAAATAATGPETQPLQRSLLADVNQVRRDHGLPPVRLNPQLSAAALAHSQQMAERG